MCCRDVVCIPYLCLSPDARENLMLMVDCRRSLFHTAFSTDRLPVIHRDKFLWFPWFTLTGDAEELETYTELIYELCHIAQGPDRLVEEFCISRETLLDLALFRLELLHTGKRHIAAQNLLYRAFDRTYRSAYGCLGTFF